MYLSKPTLTWVQRLKICIDVVRALSYLHYEDGRSYSVIHRNINSSTILLNNKFEPKLSGFEYSVNNPVQRTDQVVITEAIGTKGYMDPAIEKTGGVTHKSDIYSFGVVLYEMFYMRKAFIDNEFDRFLTPLARFHEESRSLDDIRPGVYDQVSPTPLKIFLRAAYSCTNDERGQRQDMNSIIIQLEKALEQQLQHETSRYRPNLEHSTSQFSHLKIKLADIRLATRNFSDKYRYQKDNFYEVYRAELELWDKKNSAFVEGNSESERPKRRTNVLIKHLRRTQDKVGENVFSTDVEMLATCKHRSIATLLGFCDEDLEKILVVEDGNLEPKIDDLKYSMFLPPNQDFLHLNLIRGTRFYIDPEYRASGELTRGSDVYNFGVMLFEMLCGRMANDEMYNKGSEDGLVRVARRCFLKGTVMEIIDPIIKEAIYHNILIITNEPNKQSIDTFVEVANRCVAATHERPTMKVVVEELEKALSFQFADENCYLKEHSTSSVLERPTSNYMKANLFEHLYIPLDDIKSATNNFSKGKTHYLGNDKNCYYYKAELEHFDQENLALVEDKNRRELPKKCSSVFIKRFYQVDKVKEEIFLMKLRYKLQAS